MFAAIADYFGLSSKVKFNFEFYDKPNDDVPASNPSFQLGGFFKPRELDFALNAYADTHSYWRMYFASNGAVQAVLSNDGHGVRAIGYAPNYKGSRAKVEYANPRVNEIASAMANNPSEIDSYEKWVNTCFAIPSVAAVVLQTRSPAGICAAWERTDSGIQMVVNKLHRL